MKKKTVKKLVLAKETVRSLEDGQLAEAAGGATLGCTRYCPTGVIVCHTSEVYACLAAQD